MADDRSSFFDDNDLKQRGLDAARDLLGFLDRSPTPFHAVREVVARLTSAGFSEISERDAWTASPGDKRYVVRGGTTIVAWVVGDVSPATGGFTLFGAHTDSPNLRIKPNADVVVKGYQQLACEIYGGVLLSTWMDRDLSIAGRVLLDDGGGKVRGELVNLDRAVARVPNLAIHLDRDVNKDGPKLNPQKHLVPLVGLGKEGVFKATIARAVDCAAERILGFDLGLYDVEKAALGGLEQEFVLSARLDNLGSCHAGVVALVAQSSKPSRATRVVALYDHEEVGSKSAVGAAGSILRDVLRRIAESHADKERQAFERAMASSWLVSADMAHALHPNYEDRHEPHHQPLVNRGLVIKSNANQSYATDGASAARFEALCRSVGYSAQRFVIRTDLPCGSTIGPITAAELGVATVDVGGPMLSMHSCREMAGTLDVHLAIETYKKLFE